MIACDFVVLPGFGRNLRRRIQPCLIARMNLRKDFLQRQLVANNAVYDKEQDRALFAELEQRAAQRDIPSQIEPGRNFIPHDFVEFRPIRCVPQIDCA